MGQVPSWLTRGAVAVCAAALVLSTTPAAAHDGGHSEGDGFAGDPGFVDTSDTPDFRGAGSPEPGPVVVGVGVDIDGAPTDRPEETIAAGALHTSSGGWYATASGVVVAFGGAEHLGDLDGLELNEPIVAFTPTSTGAGYWLTAADGGVFAFGDAPFHGSTGGIDLARPIVDLAPLPDDSGYYLAADDGGIFAYGAAEFAGSAGAIALNEPITGLDVEGNGAYWLVARDGGVFAFGGARFHGSTGDRPPSRDVVDLVVADGGYHLVTEGGEVLSFGAAPTIAFPEGPDDGAKVAGSVVAASLAGDGLALVVDPDPPLIVAWQSGGLSGASALAIDTAARVAGGVTSISHGGTVAVHAITRDGHPILEAQPGWQFGFGMRAVDPAAAGPFHGRAATAALARGELVMSRTSADVHNSRVGDVVHFRGWDGSAQARPVGAIVADGHVGSSELTVSTNDAASFGLHRPTSMWVTGVDDVAWFEQQLRNLSVEEPWVRWAKSWDPPRPDGVLSSGRLKALLGEFQYRLGPGDSIEIDPAWVAANIVRVDLPILGSWRCHRAVVGQLTAALTAIEEAELSSLIDVRDSRYGGCWVARRIRGASGGAISRHAWGLAIDINPSTNRWGTPPTMDPRIVEIFRAHGFAWGGTWTRPDGMHFEAVAAIAP